MKLNYETCIVGTKCILVPYRQIHVDRYHEWMQSPALLEATGSEPLSLEEEYEMQESWRVDDKKCTFIVLQRSKLSKEPPLELGERDDDFVSANLEAMVGDVNLFLSNEEDDDDDEEEQDDSEQQPVEDSHHSLRIQAELDIMIAEESARGQGIGQEASCLMMLYGVQRLGIQRFFCKINEDNESSLKLFRKLKFHECDYAACFKQYEYELKRRSPGEVAETLRPFLNSTDLFTFTTKSDAIETN